MEVPEDARDKVRRNLVSFSAGVVLLTWLRIPLQKVLEKAGIPESSSPWRTWTAAGAVLLYLWARFHYNGEGRDFLRKLKDKYEDQMYTYLHRRLGPRPLPAKTGRWVTPSPSEVLRRGEEKMAEAGASSADAQAEVFFNGERWKTTGTYPLNVQWIHGPQRFVRLQHAEEVTYRVPFMAAMWMRCKAVWFSWLFSADALSWLAPVAFAVLAAGVILWRLGIELLVLAR
jgi:hypothetical protein